MSVWERQEAQEVLPEVKGQDAAAAATSNLRYRDDVREVLRHAVRAENQARASLGSRLAARFAHLGLADDIPELRGHPACPADIRLPRPASL